MIDRVDPKGKLFTERIQKDHLEVEITTTTGRVHGYIHVMHSQRVKDLLNAPNEQFLAVTDATMDEADGKEPVRHKFITINKLYIRTVIPINESHAPRTEDEYAPY